MTARTAAHPDLSALPDDDLYAMYGDGTGPQAAAAMTEAQRRDRAGTRRRQARERRAVIDAAWQDAAYSEYLAAEAATCGVMLSAAGDAAGRQPFPLLWTCSQQDFGRYASEEMKRWRDESPTYTQRAAYFRQALKPDAGRYEDGSSADAEPAAVEDPPPLATPAASEPAPSLAGQDTAPAISGDPGASQRRADRAARTQMVRAKAAGYAPAPVARPGVRAVCEHPGRSGGSLCGDCPRRAGGSPGLASGTLPAAGSASAVEAARERLRITLDELRTFYGRYVYLPGGPDGAASIAMPLWTAHTFHRKRIGDTLGALAARATPRLAGIGGPESGKSTVLELLRVTCANTFGLDHEPTASGIIDSINDEHATLLIDEGALLIGSGKRKADVITALLGGYRPNGTKLRTRGGTSQRLSLFAPVAFAVLPEAEKGTGENIRALFTRTIKFAMQPPPESAVLADIDADEDLVEAEGARYQAALSSAMGDLAAEIAAARPVMPEGVRGRRAQIWRILLAIAEAAGGHWIQDARKACRSFCLGQADRPPMPPGVALLADLRDVWPAGAEVGLTTELARSLRGMDGAPWAGMWDAVSAPAGMAALLAPYDVSPVDVVLPDGRGVEGYRRACLEPAWAGHLAGADDDDEDE